MSVSELPIMFVFLLFAFVSRLNRPDVLMASETDRLKRKLRKKLRQIESLEASDRDLNEEERAKVEKKDEIRFELCELIAAEAEAHPIENTFTFINQEELEGCEDMKRKSKAGDNERKEKSPAKKQCSVTDSVITEQELMSPGELTESPGVEGETPLESETSVTTDASETAAPATADVETDVRRKERRAESVSQWRRAGWSVQELQGHEDTVLDCDISLLAGLALTASRDTTVKVCAAVYMVMRGSSCTVLPCTALLAVNKSADRAALPSLHCQQSGRAVACFAGLEPGQRGAAPQSAWPHRAGDWGPPPAGGAHCSVGRTRLQAPGLESAGRGGTAGGHLHLPPGDQTVLRAWPGRRSGGDRDRGREGGGVAGGAAHPLRPPLPALPRERGDGAAPADCAGPAAVAPHRRPGRAGQAVQPGGRGQHRPPAQLSVCVGAAAGRARHHHPHQAGSLPRSRR